MFNTLPRKSATGVYWWISVALHGLVLTVVTLTPLFFPERLDPRLTYNITPLMLAPIRPVPPAEPMRVPPAPVRAPKPKEPLPRELALRDAPTLRLPETTKPAAPPPPLKLEVALPDVPIEKPRLVPARTVVTDSLPAASVEVPPVNKPAREVQTGGFGDPNGTRAEGRPDRPATIARLGSFDLPAGAGVGNGTGGARGAQGVVASAGFGNGLSGDANGQRNGTGVRQGGFGDGRADPTTPVRPARSVGPSETPAEILSKPTPDYTDEARDAKDQGEVVLRVMFTATGDVRVLEIVKGLPHGLNESALRAADKIRFKPATKDGKPVDSTAVVRITFQLAN